MNPIDQAVGYVRKQHALGEAYRKVFSSPEGRLVLNDLMSVSGITRAVRSKDKDEAIQYEAVRTFVFGILKKSGVKQKQILDTIYSKMSEIADPTGSGSSMPVPPSGEQLSTVNTNSFASPAPESIL